MTGGDGEGVANRRAAQARLERIRAFQEELAELERQDVLVLTADQHERLAAHHATVQRRLGEEFDVDPSREGQRLSWGMAVASLLGALALAAAVFFAFYRFWGAFPTAIQVAVLVAAPVLTVGLTEWTARRERTPWFTNLVALVALATAVLDLRLLGGIFNIPASPHALLIWAVFALALAYAYGLRLPLFLGLIFALAYLVAVPGTWSGVHWQGLFARPEGFILAGALVLLAPLLVGHRRYPEFLSVFQLLGLVAVFLPMFLLANWGYTTYLPWRPDIIEISYQVAGFLFSAGVIAVGIRSASTRVANTGVVFFVVLLFDQFFDWCWDWMPKYLFFLIIGLAALAVLWGLGRMRKLLGEGTA